jgi:hypothetical protein
MQLRLDVRGGKELYTSLTKLPTELRKNADYANSEIARKILNKAVSNAITFADTGELAGSIKRYKPDNSSWVVEADAPHAAYMEYGFTPHVTGAVFRTGWYQRKYRGRDVRSKGGGGAGKKGFFVGTHPQKYKGRGYHAFLRPAVDSVIPEYAEAAKRYVRKAVYDSGFK